MVEFNCCGTQPTEDCGTSPSDEAANDSQANTFETTKAKRLKLPLQLNKQKKKVLSPSSRFNTTVSDAEIDKSSKGYIPKNTSRSTSWAVRVFTQWVEQRNKRMGSTYPLDLLEKAYDPSIICECLQRFVSEARRANGTNYPPKTIYQILCGLLRHSRENQSDPSNFLDRKDSRFKKLHSTCDVIFRTLHEEGIRVEKKPTPVVSKANEDKLSGNTSTPTGLQRAVFYYIGKVCCIRGGEEQRNLKQSQFKRYSNPDTVSMALKIIMVAFFNLM